MVAAILPLYLFYTLGFTPLQFGVVDGLQQGAAAIVRVAGGFVADRTRRHKEGCARLRALGRHPPRVARGADRVRAGRARLPRPHWEGIRTALVTR